MKRVTKVFIIVCIILIPIIIGMIAFDKVPFLQNNFFQQGGYVQAGNAPVTYNQQDINKLSELEHNRQKLSEKDALIKVQLIRRENPLAKTDEYTITYDRTTDMFQAQITTISIDTAKKEVDQWFFDQGMSVAAPCELPVSFSLDPSIVDSLKGFDVVFSPLAPGC